MYILFACVACDACGDSLLPPRRLAVVKFDAATGKNVWKNSLPKDCIPECAVLFGNCYALIFAVEINGAATRDNVGHMTVFYDAVTGKKTKAFDLRQLSGYTGTFGPRELVKERDQESGGKRDIRLSNGWHSVGVPLLRDWFGTHTINFVDDRLSQKWETTLPTRTFSLSCWKDVLVYEQRVKEGGNVVDHLYGQKAGSESRSWEFVLPGDIPTNPASTGLKSRGLTFSYAVGAAEIFVFGDGILFGLIPNTGQVTRRCDFRGERMVNNDAKQLLVGDVYESGGELFIVSGRIMVSYCESDNHVKRVVRTDVYDGLPLMCIDNSMICVIER